MNHFRLLRLLIVSLLTCFVSGISAAQGYASRDDVMQFIDDMHARNGFDTAELRSLFGEVQMIPNVIKYILPPSSPRQRSWRTYRSRYLDGTRITNGLAFWRDHAEELKRAADTYGVPEEIIVAIIGVETIYGRNVGNFQTLSALSTLAFDYPPRAELFRSELEQLLLLARDQKRDVRNYVGSYAGALGLPQFLPSSIRRYAVDFDGDGSIDLYASASDAIGSVANFLKEHGWERGGPVALRVIRLENDPAPLIDQGIEPKLNTDDLQSYGMSTRYTAPPATPFALVDLVTPDEDTEYWLGFRNFYVITRYNRSSFYAMSVYELADALRTAWSARENLQ